MSYARNARRVNKAIVEEIVGSDISTHNLMFDNGKLAALNGKMRIYPFQFMEGGDDQLLRASWFDGFDSEAETKQ